MMPVPIVDSTVGSTDDGSMVTMLLKSEPLDDDYDHVGGVSSSYTAGILHIKEEPEEPCLIRATFEDHNRIRKLRMSSTDSDNTPTQAIFETHDAPQRDLMSLSMGKKLLENCKAGIATEVQRLMLEGAPFIADWVGTSPLHFSVMNKHVQVTEQLLKAGICKDVRNRVDRTPLHVAAHMGLPYMVKLLLTYGADVNCKDMLGMTPLHWVAESGDVLSAKILLDYGADVSATNKFRKTAFEIASMNNHYELTNVIQEVEQLPKEVRSAREATLKMKTLGSSRVMKPVAEIFEPPKAQTCQARKRSQFVLVTKNDNDSSSRGTLQIASDDESEGELPLEVCPNDKMTTSSAIKLLKSHGVRMVEPDQNTVLSSAVLNGHTIRLTDAGKLAFKSLENEVNALDDSANCRLPSNDVISPERSVVVGKPTAADDDLSGPSPLKITRLGNGLKGQMLHKVSAQQLIEMKKENKIVIKAAARSKIALPSYFVDIPGGIDGTADVGSFLNIQSLPEGYAERSAVYVERLAKKATECERQVAALRSQLAAKEQELVRVTKQLDLFKSCSVAK